MTLLAAFMALLHRYSGQDDVAVGSPVGQRDREELEGLIGLFVGGALMLALGFWDEFLASVDTMNWMYSILAQPDVGSYDLGDPEVLADGTTIDAFTAIGTAFSRNGMDIGDLVRFQKRRKLFKYLGGVDSFPVMLDTKDPVKIIDTVLMLQPTFGGINLEDISQPKCFQILDTLREKAVFSVFRRSSEMPLYRIEKTPRLARRQGAYSVISATGLIVRRGHELDRVLRAIDVSLSLVAN